MRTIGLILAIGGVVVVIEAFKHFGSQTPSASAAASGVQTTVGNSPELNSHLSSGTTSPSNPQSVVGYGNGINSVIQTANNLGIDPNALLALVAWESNNFNPQAAAVTSRENSHGYYQLNLNVHPISQACADDPACASNYWQQAFGPRAKALYDALGGDAAFQRDPSGFLQAWVPRVQGSDPWTPTIAQIALQRVAALRQSLGI